MEASSNPEYPDRCTSTGRKCDGYTQDASFGFEALVPSQLGSVRTSIPILSGLGDSVIYLEFYHHCASPTLASNFDREFWSHTVLQMAYSEPSVRHALIALSYLVKTMPGSLKHARSIPGVDSHTTLLVHYNKAVRSLVERATQSSQSVEVGLITCLLFICIEFLRGDYLVAFTHLQNGLKIIAEWQQTPQQVPNDDLHYRAHLLTCHESWLQAMKVLENGGNLSKQDSLVASSLRLSHYATYIALAGATDIYQMSFDAHIADFEALNHHARIVLDSMNLPSSSPGTPTTSPSSSASSDPKDPAAHFTFEIALIPPLVSKSFHLTISNDLLKDPPYSTSLQFAAVAPRQGANRSLFSHGIRHAKPFGTPNNML
ncbi:hypothetical protein N0V83_004372 [Neocucurbitaria cava]|uniref:Uncharacterized protein n=1 Tax=Neocucurbitaria cava TaxID=798079 RepID=A0A9W8Y9J3_9PLEO|nr:hypothetical protein N0V83_004372 [Neocucurbitaria cava]